MNKEKFKFVIGILLVIVVVILSGAIVYKQEINGMSSKPAKDNTQQEGQKQKVGYGLNVGNYAPDFELENLAGEKVSLSDYRGKYVLLNFWATWCPPCRKEMPDLNEFHQENKDEFVVLGVDIGESKEHVKSFIQAGGYDYPILLDINSQAAYLYKISAIPTSYFINPEGRIEHIKRGLITKSELEDIKVKILP